MTLVRALLIAAMLCASTAQAQSVAFTFDDGPKLETTPLLSPQQRNQALLGALAAHHVQAALFVTCGYGADKPEGYALAKAWGQAGHALGNHTMTHPDLNDAKLTLAQYQQEVQDCDRITSTLPGYQKWFRYTFLREGNTPEKRDGMRAFLKESGYRNGYVSLDTSDWRLDEKLTDVLRADPKADIEPIRQAYLSHLRQRAIAYRDLSRKLEGRDIPQVMLMHHNLINALWLKDAIQQFIDMGWTIVTPAQAYADPIYQLQPERPAPGQSLLLSIARTRGMGKFEGWERLVDDGDFEINALAVADGAPAPDPRDTANMARCRALLAKPFPLARFEALFKTTLVLDVKKTPHDCVYGYFDKANPNAGALLVLSFSHRKDSLKNYEESKNQLRGDGPHLPDSAFDFTYHRYGLYFIEVLTTEKDWVVVATARQQLLPEAARLAVDFMKTATMQKWAPLPD
ncbi:hypothetical protein RugamoR57_25110 [Duganella caerulea]|uniref:polysaccharide deacetylase family protein n=1 Tax=Duganella caerulea TaxID=2885762 RepID=UPI0030EA97C7